MKQNVNIFFHFIHSILLSLRNMQSNIIYFDCYALQLITEQGNNGEIYSTYCLKNCSFKSHSNYWRKISNWKTCTYLFHFFVVPLQKLNATIDLKRFILFSEENPRLSSSVHWSCKTQEKNCSHRHTFEDQKGTVLCVCVYEGERKRRGPLWTAAISNNSKAFYQSSLDHQLVESWLNWLTVSCVGSLQLTSLTSRLHANHTHTKLIINWMHVKAFLHTNTHTKINTNTQTQLISQSLSGYVWWMD